MIKKRTIDLYRSAGRQLTPLHIRSKKPLHRNWTERRYPDLEIYQYAKKGHNIGWVLGPADLVIDVDPKNSGLIGLEKLLVDWQIGDLAYLTPTVLTGNDGFHYYLRLPKRKFRLRTTLAEYAGIDFRRQGHQVLVPGSIHPDTGKEYRWQIGYLPTADRLICPDWLIGRLKYDQKPLPLVNHATQIDPIELAYLLKQLPIDQYRSNDLWQPILMASHHATNGSGIDVFLDWSLSDPLYADHADIISARWRSLSADRSIGRPITVATLYDEVLKNGGSIRSPSADFADRPADRFNVLLDQINRWPPDTSENEITEVAKQSFPLGPLIVDRIRSAVTRSIGCRSATVDKIFREAERSYLDEKRQLWSNSQSTDPDWAEQLAKMTLSDRFAAGRNLIHHPNQIYYEYTGRFWDVVKVNAINNILYRQAYQSFSNGSADLPFKISLILPRAERVLSALTATKDDVFRFTGRPPSVVNTTNYELWLDEKTGRIDARPHRSDSYLLACLDVEYDRSADCPLFKQTLDEIFSNAADRPGLIRHLMELFGYVIQPNKNIAAWFLFHGQGWNGKSVIVDVLTALIGPNAALPRAVHEFSNTLGNNHAYASLPGKLLLLDDDADTSRKLPESALKKLAEGKLLEANPKHRDTFNFRSVATPIICANSWPIIHDLSIGMRRRINVIPFRRRFSSVKRDTERANRLIRTELSGILNMALAGLARLRSRGWFDPPIDCIQAFNQWMQSGNSVIKYLNTKTKPDISAVVDLSDMYDDYREWCAVSGMTTRPAYRSSFENTLVQFDLCVECNQVKGVRLV